MKKKMFSKGSIYVLLSLLVIATAPFGIAFAQQTSSGTAPAASPGLTAQPSASPGMTTQPSVQPSPGQAAQPTVQPVSPALIPIYQTTPPTAAPTTPGGLLNVLTTPAAPGSASPQQAVPGQAIPGVTGMQPSPVGPQQGVQTPAQAAPRTPTSVQQPTQQFTPQQAESAMKQLTPDQQRAVQAELLKSGGAMTPATLDALRMRPEFQNLTQEEILKGKQMLDQQARPQEARPQEIRELEKRSPMQTMQAIQTMPTLERQVLGMEPPMESLFDRSRRVGKYQEISLSLRPFGFEFFQEGAMQVQTERKDVPVPLKYVIGPGDEVKILVWGRVNTQYNLIVDRDGKIMLPQIGPVFVAGKTFEEMSKSVIDQITQIMGANADISMGGLKTIPVFVLGDVRRPGSYTVGAFSTITDVLILAGGPSAVGSMRQIQLKRNNKLLTTFDLYDLLLKGDKSKDTILQAGDIVFVPVSGPLVGIAGNVKRPAIYEMKDQLDLREALNLAGGIIPTAYTQQIQVERIVRSEKQIVVDIDDKLLEKTRSVELLDADLVKIFSIVEMNVNAVYLNGNVKRPGKYEYKPGQRLKDILKSAQELLPETYFDYALIKRLKAPSMEAELIPFSVRKLLMDNAAEANLELRPLDNIFIFNKWTFQDRPFFNIGGEVRSGGRFELLENYRIRDAILAAGDVTKNAYLKKGEIVRVDKKKEYRTLYFDVARAMAGDPAENLLLEDEDRITIHSLYEEQWKQLASVTGEVKNPGDFVLTEGMRVSDLIFKAGGQTRDTLLDRAELYRTDWKTKEVTLKGISLGKALAGDASENLELKDLDRLIVHSIWEQVYKKNVAVEGDVLKPGTYQLADNMTVRDLVFAAGNVLEAASLQEAEVSSQGIDQGNQAYISHRQINLGKALAGDPEHNLALKPYDRLFIKRIPDWHPEKYVTMAGEIKFPGRYVIKKGEKLSSLIERAGGLRENAYLRGAFFTRERVREMQQKSLAEMADRMERDLQSAASGQISTALSTEEVAAKKAEMEQKQKFIDTVRKLKATGRMTIYLAHLRLLKGSPYDLELEEGDSLFIPQKNSVVGVVGSVMSQASLIYSDRLSYLDYINESGGYSRFADEDNVFVMKVDGSARKLSRGVLSWSAPRERWEVAGFGEPVPMIEPGDTIVVPEKVERIAWLREIRDITQILMNVAVAAGVVIALY